jgi:hypothetical protein
MTGTGVPYLVLGTSDPASTPAPSRAGARRSTRSGAHTPSCAIAVLAEFDVEALRGHPDDDVAVERTAGERTVSPASSATEQATFCATEAKHSASGGARSVEVRRRRIPAILRMMSSTSSTSTRRRPRRRRHYGPPVTVAANPQHSSSSTAGPESLENVTLCNATVVSAASAMTHTPPPPPLICAPSITKVP